MGVASQATRAVTFLLACGFLACGGAEEASERAPTGGPAQAGNVTSAVTPEAEAQQIFSTRCAVCHGPEGRGNGPGASALDPKPRDYTNEEWQETVTDEQIRQAIVYGGAAVGKSPSMVANPDLNSKPAVTAALVEIIRGFAGES